MHQLLLVGDARSRPEELRHRLRDLFEVSFQPVERVRDLTPRDLTLLDIDLANERELLTVKEWLKNKPKNSKIFIAIEKASRLQEARALALGATAIIPRPIDAGTLLTMLSDNSTALTDMGAGAHGALGPGATAALDALENIFSAACSGKPVDAVAVQTAGNAIVNQLEAQGLPNWIDTVRTHHSQTYQHCLLVTGVAAAFGEHIGLSRKDRQRLSFAGMLHDIGKARIPLAILEKPGRLNDAELALMRKHPEYGFDALKSASALPPEMIDIVVHHHEMLDGSGYPHGLHGSEICDLVRIMTIADVFGALIERRSYKPPLSGEAAYQILLDMGSKLDKDLVRAFKFASRVSQSAAA
jgi:putative nucleotidyltransferase with HDIG domain